MKRDSCVLLECEPYSASPNHLVNKAFDPVLPSPQKVSIAGASAISRLYPYGSCQSRLQELTKVLICAKI